MSSATGGRDLVIAIETSTRAPSLAARRGIDAPHAIDLCGERAHASDLLPALERLLALAGASRNELRRVVVGLGPGSLTGLRVGVATALGLVRASGAELVGVPSFEALAARDLSAGSAALLLGDARGGRFNTAVFERRGDALHAHLPISSLDEREVREALQQHLAPGRRVFADESATERFDLAPFDPEPLVPSALDVLLLGEHREPASDIALVQPLYLRPFEARAPRRR